jgi:hypothetical protein
MMTLYREPLHKPGYKMRLKSKLELNIDLQLNLQLRPRDCTITMCLIHNHNLNQSKPIKPINMEPGRDTPPINLKGIPKAVIQKMVIL